MALQQQIHFDELLAWKRQNNKTFRDLASLSGLDKMTVQRLCAGNFKTFVRAWVPAIEKATGSSVGWREFAAFLERLSYRSVPRPLKASTTNAKRRRAA